MKRKKSQQSRPSQRLRQNQVPRTKLARAGFLRVFAAGCFTFSKTLDCRTVRSSKFRFSLCKNPNRLLKNSVSPHHSDRKSTRLNSSHSQISYAVFCLKKKKNLD